MSARAARNLLVPYAFVLPAMAVLGVFIVGSFVQVIVYSLGVFNPFEQSYEFTGLANYIRLWEDDRFWWCLANSGLYLLVTPVLIVLSLSCAIVIDARVRGHAALRLLFFLPVVTPTIVAAVGWRILFNEESGLLSALAEPVVGVLNATLDPQTPWATPAWLTERPWTLIAPMVVTTWKGFGFYMMIFLAGLLNVPRELREAAALDGAGRWGVFRNVVLPGIWPIMTLVIVISSISALKVFDEIFVTVRGVPLEHQTAVPYVYETAFGDGNFGIASAAGVVLFAVLLVFSLINLRLTRSKP
ncbi:MAG: sugar ABC transporter permease [Phycisphaerales bacterium]